MHGSRQASVEQAGLLHDLSIVSGSSEVDCLLPLPAAPGVAPKASRHAHKRSLSSTLWALSVEYQPRKIVQGNLEGGGAQETEEQEAGADDGPTLPGVVSQAREWLWTATPMLPKVSWGWLPFGFTFLGLSTASKLLLFVTAFAVYCSALMYRLYEHTQGCDTMAALGQEALGRFGRNLVNGFTLAINIALPVVSHVGGARFFQYALFPGTGVCLPWVSLLFGALVLGLGQIQRLGTLPRLATVVIPVLALGAVALTITQLLLLKAAGAGPAQEEQGLVYVSDYALAVVALISANYFGQHTFPEMIVGMEHPAHFPHATATAQVLTLMLNAAVGLASFHVPSMHVHGFISFAFNSNELLPRLINGLTCLVIMLKYVQVLNMQTKGLIPWLPHLMSQVVDPTGVETGCMTIHPRELWLIASTSVVAYSYLIANTFPHTFMGLSGLLTSVAHIPLAFTLPCVFSIKLLSHNLSALEYTLATWIIPVSAMTSILGIWASIYHLVSRWTQTGGAAGSWGCNAL